jgi:hypothetical protein
MSLTKRGNMKEQKAEIQLEVVKRVAQSNWSVEDLKAVDDLLTDLYIKGQEQTEKDRREFEEWRQKKEDSIRETPAS